MNRQSIARKASLAVGALLLGAMAFLVNGCQTVSYDTTKLSSRQADGTFNRISLTMSGTYSGQKVDFFVKPFEHSGKLAICGYRVRLDGSLENLMEASFKKGNLNYQDAGSKKVIASTNFIKINNPKPTSSDYVADCVQTDFPYPDTETLDKLRFHLGAVQCKGSYCS